MQYVSKILTAVLSVALVSACGSDGDGKAGDDGASDTYNQTPASGKINGLDWTFAFGRVLVGGAIGGEDTTGSFTLLSASVSNACDAFAPFEAADELKVNWSSSLVPGETLLGASGKNVTFQKGNGNDIDATLAQEGKFSIDSVTTTAVAGRMIAHMDADHSINGTFTVAKCCQSEGGSGYELCTE